MKAPFITLVSALCVIMLASCSGSGSSDGNAARRKFKARTQVELPAGKAAQFEWVQVGDTYGEYFRFECDREFARNLVEELALTGAGSFSPTPNDPHWWEQPSGAIHTKDGFSDVTYGSKMTFWYNPNESAGYLDVEFWD